MEKINAVQELHDFKNVIIKAMNVVEVNINKVELEWLQLVGKCDFPAPDPLTDNSMKNIQTAKEMESQEIVNVKQLNLQMDNSNSTGTKESNKSDESEYESD